MKKKLTLLLTLLLTAALLVGCTGTPVIYHSGDCDCPEAGNTLSPTPSTPSEPADNQPAADQPAADQPAVEGAVKTGLAIVASTEGSADASAEADGTAKFDVTLVAVTVDDNGVIQDCIIDNMNPSLSFNAKGEIAAPAEVLTKAELGDDYGMKVASSIGKEWYEQAEALAAYACGKTVEELKNGAISETGAPADADLASSATMYLGGFVSAIEKAVANATHLGAQTGDTLRLASVNSLSSSASATAEGNGTAQLNCDVTALTEKDGVITSCALDSLQAKVLFDAAGKLLPEQSTAPLTKNELGEDYGMKAYAGSAYEWNEQAAAFAAYVTGKTLDEVKGIAVTESTAPAEADLASTVTISIAGFQGLIEKAMQK